jgi:hypothetical protein
MNNYNNSNPYNDVLNDLQDYMLYEDNMIKSLRLKIEPLSKDTKCLKQTTNTRQQIFIPNQHDSLFWCFYIIKNGDIKYETLNNKNSLLAKQMKIELVDSIRKHKDVVKMYKFDTISNLESNLANDNNLNDKTFFTLCAIENINIIFLKKNTYYEMMMNDSDTVYIVHEIQSQSKYNNKYGFELGTNETINNIRNTFFRLEAIDKPIKAISAYKVDELINICNKLVIDIYNNITGKQKSKKELYEAIIQYF